MMEINMILDTEVRYLTAEQLLAARRFIDAKLNNSKHRDNQRLHCRRDELSREVNQRGIQ